MATGDTQVMMAAQHEILDKPFGTSWITYTRSHDDIGLGYDDSMIRQAGFSPYEHRSFLNKYFSGTYEGSPAMGALFSFNPKTGDARISGSLASLCGLEKALLENDVAATGTAIRKILMMQAQSFFIGGVPMLYYGDEIGTVNDYAYLDDPGKSYDNRWMHRPVTDWNKMKNIDLDGTVEQRIFSGTQQLIGLRKKIAVVADHSNLTWLNPHNIHVAAFCRASAQQKLFCLFNFSNAPAYLTWYAFKEQGAIPVRLYDHWQQQYHIVGSDHEYLVFEPYGFYLMEPVLSEL